MARSIAAVAADRLDLDLHSLSAEWERGCKGGPYVRWTPGVLSTARTQENGESTFHTAGLFHPSTIYITEIARMYKNFPKYFLEWHRPCAYGCKPFALGQVTEE